jgi:hypothetical protein
MSGQGIVSRQVFDDGDHDEYFMSVLRLPWARKQFKARAAPLGSWEQSAQ